MTEIEADPDVLKSLVREYMIIDDQLKALRKETRKRNQKKKELSQQLMSFMKQNELNKMDTKTGSIQYATSQCKKPLTKDTFVNTLEKFFDGNRARATECMEYVWNNRDTYEKERIKRTVKK